MSSNKPGRGTLFKNTRATKESDPGLQGSINIDGREYWLSVWKNAGPNGASWAIEAKPKAADREIEETRQSDDRSWRSF